MKRCDKFTETKRFGTRTCSREFGHHGQCTADLIGLRIGTWIVISSAPPHVCENATFSQWNLINDFGDTKIARSYNLLHGRSSGRKCVKGGKGSSNDANGKARPEYNTIHGHYRFIFKLGNDSKYDGYKNMPFYDGWNPDKGGSFVAGMLWIVDNLGERPAPGWTIDIIEHARGFVPGNLRWASKRIQKDNQQHRTLGKFSVEELRVELLRHGYGIVRLVQEKVA